MVAPKLSIIKAPSEVVGIIMGCVSFFDPACPVYSVDSYCINLNKEKKEEYKMDELS